MDILYQFEVLNLSSFDDGSKTKRSSNRSNLDTITCFKYSQLFQKSSFRFTSPRMVRIQAKSYTCVSRNSRPSISAPFNPNLASNHPFVRDHIPPCNEGPLYEHSTRGNEPSTSRARQAAAACSRSSQHPTNPMT